MAVFPFIFVRDKFWAECNTFINHEKIHLRQQLELLIVPFFIWYFVEFFIRWIQFKNKKQAYRNISFEREAYANEQNIDYLKNRRFFSFIKYL